MLLEIVVFNFCSAIEAANYGADRLEVCDNFLDGGTTPSFGVISRLKERLDIPVFPMVRPRGGDFLYSKEEIEVMRRDISLFKSLGCDGIVLGCLNIDGTVDFQNLRILVDDAYPMEVTFHRAFDRVKDRSRALEDIYNSGCKRVLTSGGYPLIEEGLEELKTTVKEANGKLTIVAGGGVNSYVLPQLLFDGLTEVHSPAKIIQSSNMEYINEKMREDLSVVFVDKDEIRKMKSILNRV